MKLFFALLDSLFATRPVILVPVWGFAVFGWAAARSASGIASGLQWGIADIASLKAFLLMLLFSCAVAAVYLMNQIADIDVDAENGGLPLIASGVVGVGVAWGVALLLGGISVILPYILGYPLLSLCSIAALCIGVLYSFRPFYFSGRPFLDFISNALGYGGIAFAAGWFLVLPSFSTALCWAAVPWMLLMAAGSIGSTLPDLPGDARCGKNTTAVALGIPFSTALSILFLSIAVACAIFVNDYYAVAAGAVSLPLYGAFALKTSSRLLMESTYKIGGGLTMLCAIVIMPVLAVAGLIVLVATYLYFRVRHGVAYPSLVPLERLRA